MSTYNYITLFNDKFKSKQSSERTSNVNLLKSFGFKDYVNMNSTSNCGRLIIKYNESGAWIIYNFKDYHKQCPDSFTAVSKWYPYLIDAEKEFKKFETQLKNKNK